MDRDEQNGFCAPRDGDAAAERDKAVVVARQQRLDLPTLLSNRYFGLAGMFERAAIIGADLEIASLPNQGCRVRITWQARLNRAE